MILCYGNYRHALHEAGVTIERRTLFDDHGMAKTIRERWLIDGRLQADTPAQLTAAIRALEQAYARGNQDATLYLADGVTTTAHQLRSRQTLGGVRVVRPPAFSAIVDGEYVTFRTYNIELEADLAPIVSQAYSEFSETLNFSGGAAQWGYLPTLSGRPVRQQLRRFTTYRVTQSGRAVALGNYPVPAAPLWPTAWHADQGGVIRLAPRAQAGEHGSAAEYEVRWEYHFESDMPLAGNPTQPRR